MEELFKREGFWRSQSEPHLPFPLKEDSPWEGQDEFLSRLDRLEGYDQTRRIAYRGMSACRICTKMNGNAEYTSGNYVWPSGFQHYIREHNVRPTLGFQVYVFGKKLP